MKGRCWLFFTLAVFSIAFSGATKSNHHKLEKRQIDPRNSNERGIPLSRSRQFPPPEELEDSEEQEDSEEEESPPLRRQSPQFRGRQQPQDYSDESAEDYPYSEAPATTTTTTTAKPRISTFNRSTNRPKFGQNSVSSVRTTTPTTARTTTRSRGRAIVPAQKFDPADIVNRPPPPRPSTRNSVRKPLLEESTTAATRRVSNASRPRARGRFRARTSSTTTTTTTTTTEAPAVEEYYYYYEDDVEEGKQPVATTTASTTTTTTTTTKAPRKLSGRRGSNVRASQTSRAPVKFDPESQFQPPPDDAVVTLEEQRSTKKFTTSTTVSPPPDGIPPHLRSKYKPRKDGRFIDYLRDPNRPRELKGFDLSDYPFYIKVPEDIVFDCEDKKDGYYASVPHHCQLFHYCFAGSRYDFLCANYTLYDQTTFTCRFANNVDCPSSEKFYYRNDDLWKETTTSTTTAPPKKKAVVKDEEDYEDEHYEDDEEYYEDDEEEQERRKPRPRRRKNRRRKNRRKSTTSA